MSKIFLTGMTAQHASVKANTKNLSFAGALCKALGKAGHEVTWADPSVFMSRKSLEQFDAILVGVAPPTSLGANRIYGSLSVIDLMKDSSKLHLFVDSPNKSQIEVGLRALMSDKDKVVKDFYSYRKEFMSVKSDVEILNRVLSGLDYLYEQEWATTLVASLPWTTHESIKLAPNAKKNLKLINLDALLIQELGNPPVDRVEKWVTESQTKWSDGVASALTNPCVKMRWNKGWDDAQVMDQICRSIGAIIPPDKKDGTSWNYRYVQAVASKTPVVTDWKDSIKIGESWAILAPVLDTMNQSGRDFLALAQNESYLTAIPKVSKSLEILESALKI
jgi:hypothetical protein